MDHVRAEQLLDTFLFLASFAAFVQNLTLIDIHEPVVLFDEWLRDIAIGLRRNGI